MGDPRDMLIDLIGELGQEVFYLLDDCKTSGNVGEEKHVITTEGLDKVSDVLDRIEALPFEEPGLILGPGAMLQAAIKQVFENEITRLTAELAQARRDARIMWEAADKIEGLQSDLVEAVAVAFSRGATEWVRLNYPCQYASMVGKKATTEGGE